MEIPHGNEVDLRQIAVTIVAGGFVFVCVLLCCVKQFIYFFSISMKNSFTRVCLATECTINACTIYVYNDFI